MNIGLDPDVTVPCFYGSLEGTNRLNLQCLLMSIGSYYPSLFVVFQNPEIILNPSTSRTSGLGVFQEGAQTVLK